MALKIFSEGKPPDPHLAPALLFYAFPVFCYVIVWLHFRRRYGLILFSKRLARFYGDYSPPVSSCYTPRVTCLDAQMNLTRYLRGAIFFRHKGAPRYNNPPARHCLLQSFSFNQLWQRVVIDESVRTKLLSEN